MSRGFSTLKWPCFHNNNKRIQNLKNISWTSIILVFTNAQTTYIKVEKTCSKGKNLSINIKEVPFKSGNGMSMYSALNMAISSCQIYVLHSMLYLHGLIEDSLGDRLQSPRWKLKRLGGTLLFFSMYVDSTYNIAIENKKENWMHGSYDNWHKVVLLCLEQNLLDCESVKKTTEYNRLKTIYATYIMK